MTREERDYAKSRIEYLLKICRFDERDKEALEMAINALSQEPCDDAISREKALNIACQCGKWAYDRINELPSVTQKSKTGHWITDDAWSAIAYNTEFLEFLYNHINPNDMEHYRQMFEMKDAVAVNGAEMESSDAE